MRRLLRSWRARVAVAGHSMEPTLRDGDWLLVDPEGYAGRDPHIGELVVAEDPHGSARWLVKRVADVAADGALRLAGDHPAHAIERRLLQVPRVKVIGRPWWRYWPPARIGRVR